MSVFKRIGMDKDEQKDLNKVELYTKSIDLRIKELEKIKSGELVREEFPLNWSRNQNAVQMLENLILTKLGLTKGNFCI